MLFFFLLVNMNFWRNLRGGWFAYFPPCGFHSSDISLLLKEIRFKLRNILGDFYTQRNIVRHKIMNFTALHFPIKDLKVPWTTFQHLCFKTSLRRVICILHRTNCFFFLMWWRGCDIRRFFSLIVIDTSQAILKKIVVFLGEYCVELHPSSVQDVLKYFKNILACGFLYRKRQMWPFRSE